MALACVFECDTIEFDVYDSERVPVGKSTYKYYVTPSRVSEIEQWLRLRNLDKVTTRTHMEELIAIGLIGEY